MPVIAEARIMRKYRMNGGAMPRHGFTGMGKICMDGEAMAFRMKWQTAK